MLIKAQHCRSTYSTVQANIAAKTHASDYTVVDAGKSSKILVLTFH